MNRVHSGLTASIPVENLSALIARLEAAEAGSREMDAAMFEFDPRRAATGYWFADEKPGATKIADHVPSVTTSLDAALALADRLGMDGFRVMYAALMNWKAHDPRGPLSQTLPLALCIATLRAKLDGYEAEGEVNKNPKAQEG